MCDNLFENEGCAQQVEFTESEINMCSAKHDKISNFFENLRKKIPKEKEIKIIHISQQKEVANPKIELTSTRISLVFSSPVI